MRTAVTVGDASGLRLAAHTLKSSSGFVGAHRLSALCQTLESLPPSDIVHAAPRLLAKVDVEVARVIDALLARVIDTSD